MVYSRILQIVLGIALSACSGEILKVHSDFLSHENLASYHVGTPDPMLRCPPIGQRLIISWLLPEEQTLYEDMQLRLRIRFHNTKEDELLVPVHERKGDYVFCLVNQAYRDTGGIASYTITLEGGGLCLDEWRHSLWVEWIPLDSSRQGSRESGAKTPQEFPYSTEELDSQF